VYLEGDEWKPFISPTDGSSFMELRTSRYGKPFVGSAGYPDDQFAIWSVPIADPCPSCGAPLRQPPKNRKVPLAICANPTIEHRYELEDWDPPTVRTIEVVPGVAEFDPAVGGEPIGGWPEPYEPIVMSFDSEGEPPKKRPSKKKAAAKKKATKKKAAKKKATKERAAENEEG
jgi:DNA topoisomerase-1